MRGMWFGDFSSEENKNSIVCAEYNKCHLHLVLDHPCRASERPRMIKGGTKDVSRKSGTVV